MIKTIRHGAARTILATVTTFTLPNAHALDYSCDEFADMAERLYTLKADGYELNEVHGTILESSQGNYEKEKLLGNLAIEVFIDDSIDSIERARKLANSRCKQ